MARKVSWLVLSCLVAVSFILTSCAPATAPTTPTTPKAPTATVPAAPTTAAPTATVTPKAPTAAALKPKYGGTINWYIPDAGGPDWYRDDTNSERIMTLVYEKLFMADWALDRNTYDMTSEVGYTPPQYMKGQLVESWEMPDLLTYILKLRKGVRFHNKPPANGRELVADDVVWTFERTLKSPYTTKTDVNRIDTVKALDKYTIEIKKKPPATAELWTGIPDHRTILPIPPEITNRQFVEITDWKQIIGTGPYTLEDWLQNSMAYFKKNPDYWGYDEKNPTNRLPYADAVRVLILPERATVLAAVRSGKIDIVTRPALSYSELQGVTKYNANLQFKGLPHSTPRIIKYAWDKKPFNDVRVRQALSMAIDRNEMVKTMFTGYATPYAAPVDPVIHNWLFVPYDKLPDKPQWTSLSVKEVLSYNPDKAKKLLADAGYASGFSTWIDDNMAEDAWGLGEITSSYLSKIGVKADVKMLEYAAYETLKMGYKNEALFIDSTGRAADPFEGLRFLYTYPDGKPAFGNFGRVNDPVYNKLFEKALATLDEKERTKVQMEAQMYSLENAFTLILPHPQIFNVWQPWIKGYQGEASLSKMNYGATISRIWIDKGN